MQGRAAFGFDCHQARHSLASLGFSLKPSGDATDQAATADRDQDYIQIGRLLQPLTHQGALTRQSLVLVVGVGHQRTRLSSKRLAGR